MKNKLKKLKTELEYLQEKREVIVESYTSFSSAPRVKTSDIADVTAKKAVVLAELTKRIDKLAFECNKIESALSDRFQKFDSKTCEILTLRYIHGYSTYKIADLTGYDRSTISKKLKRLLYVVEDI